MNMKTLSITAVITGLLLSTSATFADSQLRGGMTAVRNVADTIGGQNQYADIKWQSGRAVSSATTLTAGNRSEASFKWAERSSKRHSDSANTAQALTTRDGSEAAMRWVIRNDADQSAMRWVIRNDADQSAMRWVIRNDADQSAMRWVIRNDADQSAMRWVIRNDASQSNMAHAAR